MLFKTYKNFYKSLTHQTNMEVENGPLEDYAPLQTGGCPLSQRAPVQAVGGRGDSSTGRADRHRPLFPRLYRAADHAAHRQVEKGIDIGWSSW